MNKFDELLKCDGIAAAFNREMYQEKKISFQKYIAQLLKNYKKTFFNLPWDFGSPKNNEKYRRFEKGMRKYVSVLTKGINDSIAHYLGGKPAKAYEIFVKMMEFTMPQEADNDFNGHSIRYLYTFNSMNWGESIELPRLFRMRVSSEKFDVTNRKHIFHVPFEDRHRVRPGRYSIPGFPCLYLSGSLYTCWEEMGRPCFDSVFFSRFKVTDRLFNVLPVAHLSPKNIVDIINGMKDSNFDGALSEFAKHFSRWPLDLACSIPRKDESAYFHPEYIIPQLLFQWMIQNDSYDALLYRSVQSPNDNSTTDWRMLLNFVFPPKVIKAKDYSEYLQQMFVLTNPVSLELAISLHDDSHLTKDVQGLAIQNLEYHQMLYENFTPISGKPMRYVASDFGKAEIISASFPFARLESCD